MSVLLGICLLVCVAPIVAVFWPSRVTYTFLPMTCDGKPVEVDGKTCYLIQRKTNHGN